MKKICLLLCLLFNAITYSRNVYIASFNTLHLGKSKNKDYKKIANFLDSFHVVALQEVMDEKGVIDLIDELNNQSDYKWNYNISPYSLGNGSYKEYYAFIWKEDGVRLKSVEGIYPQNTEFKRPPYAVTFQVDEIDFTFVNVHIVFGDNKSLRQKEVLQLNKVYDYYQGINKDENDVLIGGDFNLPAYDEAFNRLLSHEEKLFYSVNPKNKTTIGKKGLSSSYDNIFYSYKYTGEYTGKSGIIDFTNSNYKVVRRVVSDHLPVFMEMNTEIDDD